MKTKPSLDERLKTSVGKSAHASMVPNFHPTPPPPKEVEYIPELSELVEDKADRLKLVRAIDEMAAWKKQEREAKSATKPLTAIIKNLLGKHGVAKCICDGHMVNYYNAPRSTLSRELLMEHGVSPQILEACTVVKDSFTLRVSEPGDEPEYTPEG